MNEKIIRATWENSIVEYQDQKVERQNNIIIGISLGIVIMACAVVLVLVQVMELGL
jgi:hypothetical protein